MISMTTDRRDLHEAGDLTTASDDRRVRTGAEGAAIRRPGQRGGGGGDGGQLVRGSSCPRRCHGGQVLQLVEALRGESAAAADRGVRDESPEADVPRRRRQQIHYS